MTEIDRSRLRATFNQDAELYDRCRPGYPPQVFEDLAALAPIGPRSRVLEIGCGTGQATVPLARLGCAITTVELGAALATVARRNLAGFAKARIVVSAFEEWPLPTQQFDVVMFATAFHWIDPNVRMSKTAEALRPGGALAVVSTHHVAGGTERFFTNVQRCYERFDPGSTAPGLQLPATTDVTHDVTEFDASGRFGPVEYRRYEWEQSYTAEQYLQLLATYSGHRAMPHRARKDLFACINKMIDDQHAGQITKRYLTQLAITHRTR